MVGVKVERMSTNYTLGGKNSSQEGIHFNAGEFGGRTRVERTF